MYKVSETFLEVRLDQRGSAALQTANLASAAARGAAVGAAGDLWRPFSQ